MEIIDSISKRQWVLFTVSLSTFMATIDGSIVNLSLPLISQVFTASLAKTSWIVSTYLLTISALLLIWGRLSDLIGRKKLFAIGLGVFVMGSLLCGVSQSLPMLVGSRIIQGVGASITMALVQGIVTSIFPGHERGKALGVIATVVALGSLLGPSIGSMIIRFFSWQMLFFVNVPIGLVAIFLTIKLLPDTKNADQDEAFDRLGALMLVLWVIVTFAALMLYAERLIPVRGMLFGLIVSVVLGFSFLDYEKKQLHPLLPLSLFSSPVFFKGVMTSYISYGTLYAYIILMPFYLQEVHDLSILQTGLLLSLYPLLTAFVAPFSGHLSDRLSFRPLTILGMALSAAAYLLLSMLQASTPIWIVAAAIGMLGVATGLFQSPNTSSIMGSVDRRQLGIAGSMNAFFRNFGMVSGTAVSILLFTLFSQRGMETLSEKVGDSYAFMTGFQGVLRVAAALSVVGFAIMVSRKSES